MVDDDEIAALYRLPLGDFTAARNALARARGANGTAVKALEKPSLAAWAVNQLYWRDRPVYDALIDAAVAMRQAHVQAIAGHGADVSAADARHAAARRTAADATARLLADAGEKATPATIDAVAETLQALPSADHAPGRLARPLKPLGFAALMALGIQGAGGPEVQGSRGPEVQGSERVAARKAAQRALRAAEVAEAKAEAAVASARAAADDAHREVARVRDRLAFLEKQREDAEETVRRQTRALQDATHTRAQAAQDLARLPD